MKRLAELPADGGAEAHLIGPFKGMANLPSTNLPTSIIPAQA